MFLHAQQFEVKPLRCNSKFNEFAPVVFNGGVVFCSDKPSRNAITFLDADGNHPSKIYYSTEDGNGNAQIFSENFVTRLNEGPACFNAEQTEIIYTATIRSGQSSENHRLGLFIAIKSNEGWSSSRAFEHNAADSSYNMAHPSLSADGKTLYFTSDMVGGYGGKDLYKCEKVSTGWSKPENLGPSVNSAFNEIFPFVSADGKLYFTSLRDEKTGMDIFISNNSEGKWQKPVALDSPINSEFDDFSFTMNADGESGFLASNRNGTNDDVYSFNYNYPLFEGCPPVEKPTFCYLFEELNILPNDSMPLKYEWEFGDGATGEGLSAEHCFNAFGDYHVGLNVYDSLTRVKFARVSEVDVSIAKSQFPFIESADSSLTSEAITFSPEGTDIDNFKIDQYYWDFGDGMRGKGPQVEHSYKEPGVYTVQIGLLSLYSEDGAVERRCASKQIAVGTPEQLTAINTAAEDLDMRKSFLHNDMVFSKKDSIQTLEYKPDSTLYYVEFKASPVQIPLDDPYFENIKYEITERYNPSETLYKYSVGNTSEMQVLVRIYQDLVDVGYDESLVREEKTDVFSYNTTKKWWFIPDSITTAINKHLNKFNDIRFDRDQYVIQKGSYDNLEYIAQVMLQEPELILRVMAHTDSLGSEEHNLKLSQLRAEAVADFLQAKGIAKERLVPTGYGEFIPLASNSDESGRALNRRVSFEISIDTSRSEKKNRKRK